LNNPKPIANIHLTIQQITSFYIKNYPTISYPTTYQTTNSLYTHPSQKQNTVQKRSIPIQKL